MYLAKYTHGPLVVYTLPYEIDCIDRYENFCHLEGFVLLESQDKQFGRYDIMAACPHSRFVRYQKDNITEVYQQFDTWLPKRQNASSLPFQGGALGYLSYELGARCMDLATAGLSLYSDELPLIDMGLYGWAFIVDHFKKTAQLAILPDDDDSTDSLAYDLLQRWQSKNCTRQAFDLTASFYPLLSFEVYQDVFYKIKQDLKQGRAYQVNFTQPFVAQYHGHTWPMYKLLRKQNPVPFAAYLSLQNHVVISCSPERFLLKERQELLTSPIKGSARRVKDQTKDKHLKQQLLESEKNKAENTMIVDLMRNDLGRLAQAGTVKVEALCSLQSFNAVHHLVSDIKAQLRPNIKLCDILQACFPGGSITGAPKREVMKIISELEQYQRHIYCGSIGYFSSHGRFDTNIAIRTIIAQNDRLYLSAGGGIVMDSCCEDEYQECYTKIAAITQALKI